MLGELLWPSLGGQKKWKVGWYHLFVCSSSSHQVWSPGNWGILCGFYSVSRRFLAIVIHFSRNYVIIIFIEQSSCLLLINPGQDDDVSVAKTDDGHSFQTACDLKRSSVLLVSFLSQSTQQDIWLHCRHCWVEYILYCKCNFEEQSFTFVCPDDRL